MESKPDFVQRSERILERERKAKAKGLVRRHNRWNLSYDPQELRLDYEHESLPISSILPQEELPESVLVIVVAFNCWAHTRLCLDSLIAYRAEVPYRVVVIDNGSIDETPVMLRRISEVHFIEVLTNTENLGLSKAVNQGLALRRPGEDVVLLNNDIIVGHKWMEKLASSAAQSPKVGVVGCQLRGMDGDIHHGGAIMQRDWTGATNLWNRSLPNNGVCSHRREVDLVMFSAVYLPEEAILALGGLDEDYFAYFEDSDTCFRLRELGFSVIYDGSISLLHYHNATTTLNQMDFKGIFETSRTRFVSKWQEAASSRKKRYTGFRQKEKATRTNCKLPF
jgi:GT2 family glycosyltransferase